MGTKVMAKVMSNDVVNCLRGKKACLLAYDQALGGNDKV
jgi:hypothetical protein